MLARVLSRDSAAVAVLPFVRAAADPACAASTCSQGAIARSLEPFPIASATSPIESIAVVAVLPTFAHTKHGTSPAATSWRHPLAG